MVSSAPESAAEYSTPGLTDERIAGSVERFPQTWVIYARMKD